MPRIALNIVMRLWQRGAIRAKKAGGGIAFTPRPHWLSGAGVPQLLIQKSRRLAGKKLYLRPRSDPDSESHSDDGLLRSSLKVLRLKSDPEPIAGDIRNGHRAMGLGRETGADAASA